MPSTDLETAIDAARSASILACVTFSYRRDRLGPLFEALRGLADFPVHRLDAKVITDTVDPAELAQLLALCLPLFRHGRSLAIETFGGLDDPATLSWCHKGFITADFLAGPRAYSHFLHTEADLSFAFSNFCYFIDAREKLRRHGLIPGFQRAAFSAEHGMPFSSDQFGPTRLDNRSHAEFDGWHWMNMENPHDAVLLLDQGLAAEYVATRSFDRIRSAEVIAWGVRERAAMGLRFEVVPPGFYARAVVPVDPETLTSPTQCWALHRPEGGQTGTQRMDSLFSRGAGRA